MAATARRPRTARLAAGDGLPAASALARGVAGRCDHEEVVVVSVLSISPARLRRQRRAVVMKVLEWGHEVDSFETTSPELLRTVARGIYNHLPADASVRFVAVDEEWLPLGLDHIRREAELPGLDDALQYLAA